MSNFDLLTLNSIQALREHAEAWDDLWRRSEAPLPTLRAELLAQWLEQFAPHRPFHAVVARRAGRFVAALPLVEWSVKRFLRVGGLPSDPWSSSGDLLFDPQCDSAAALDQLVSGFAETPWRLLWLEGARVHSPRWQALRAAIERAGRSQLSRVHYWVGQVEIGSDWKRYQASRSKNHRKHVALVRRRLEQLGPTEAKCLAKFEPDEIEPLMRRGFEVEDRSWKGAAGTSVLRTPGMFEFLCRQARQLAKRDSLYIHFLEHADRAIAFEYGMGAKGTYFDYKIAYDPEFGRFSPGHLLTSLVLERHSAGGEFELVDFCGPISQATAKFATRKDAFGRLVVATGRPGGETLFKTYQAADQLRQRLRPRAAPPEFPIRPLPPTTQSPNQPQDENRTPDEVIHA